MNPGIAAGTSTAVAATPVDPPAAISVAPVFTAGVLRLKVCNASGASTVAFNLVVNYAVL